MNGSTKQRYISTSIWSDDWFDSLSEREKLVYFYLLTNEHTNAAGVYQCTLKNVRLETGLEREEVERIMAKFTEAGKAFYFKEYIIIPKWLKHQKIKERSGLFLGAVKVLKSLPDEVKYFISDRRHYDYDVSPYTGNPPPPLKDLSKTSHTPPIDPPPDLPTENGTPSIEPPPDFPPENGTPSIEPPPDFPIDLPHENGEHPPQSTAQKPHDLDLDLDLEFNINNTQKNSEDPPPDLPAYFIARWQKAADVFNCLARIKRPRDWQAFWEQNTIPLEQIDLAIDNFIEGVKAGVIERRFIPSSPDGFVLNGWLQRSAEPFKKQQDKRISNDNVDDISQYFTEV